MADEGSKQIKVSFKVDEQSAQRAKTVIAELVQAAQKLSDTLRGVGMSGGGAGGMIAGNVGKAPSFQGAQAAMQGAGRPSGGQGQGFADIFINAGKAIKDIAAIGPNSMRIMSDGIKRAVDEQKRSIAGLDSQLAQLAKRYDDLKSRKAAAIAGGMPGAQAETLYGAGERGLQSITAPIAAQRAQAAMELGQLTKQQQNMDGGAGGGSWYQNATGNKLLQQRLAESGGGGGGSFLDSARGFLTGGGLMRAGMYAGTALYGGQKIAEEMAANPMRMGRAEAQRAANWAPIIHSYLRGDLGYQRVLSRMSTAERGEFRDIAGSNIDALGGISLNPMNIANSIHSLSDVSLSQVAQQRQVEYLDSKLNSDVMQRAMEQKFSGEYGSRMAMMRRLGRGYYNAPVYGVSIQGQNMIPMGGEQRYGPQDFMQPMRNKGFQDSEIMGMFSQIAGAGGQGAGFGLTDFALRAQAAGMGNAGSVAGAAALGGNAGGFMGTLFGDRMDINARTQLGSIAAQQFGDGGAMTGGLGLAAALGGSGFGLGHDMLTAQQMAGGVGAYGRLLGGGQDGYQKGRNLVAAIDALGPGSTTYAQDYLANKMTPRMMADIMAGGEKNMPQYLLDKGITFRAVQDFHNSTSRSTMDRFILQGGGSKEMALARRIKASGMTPEAFIRSLPQKEQERAINQFGGILESTDSSLNTQAAIGEARFRVNLGRRGSRGGPGDAAHKSAEEAEALNVAKQQKVLEDMIIQQQADIKTQATKAIDNIKTFQGFSEDLSKSAEQVGGELLKLGIILGKLNVQLANGHEITKEDIAKANKEAADQVAKETAKPHAPKRAVPYDGPRKL